MKRLDTQARPTGYVQDRTEIPLASTNNAWDGIKYTEIAVSQHGPETVEFSFAIKADAGTVQAVVRLYDINDTLLVDKPTVTVPTDGQFHVYTYTFDVAKYIGTIVVPQLEVLVSADGEGMQTFAEIRWY